VKQKNDRNRKADSAHAEHPWSRTVGTIYQACGFHYVGVMSNGVGSWLICLTGCVGGNLRPRGSRNCVAKA